MYHDLALAPDRNGAEAWGNSGLFAQGVTLGAPPDDWRETVLTEIDLADPRAPTRFQSAFGLGETRCNAAVLRSADWTYAHFNGGVAPMLFDRRADPLETHDLADDPAHRETLLAMARAMLDLRMTRADRRLTGWAIGV